jgi:hypothetical protein
MDRPTALAHPHARTWALFAAHCQRTGIRRKGPSYADLDLIARIDQAIAALPPPKPRTPVSPNRRRPAK